MSTADRYVAALAELAAITKERNCLDNYTRKLTAELDEAQSQVDLWEKQHAVACEHWGAIEDENARLRAAIAPTAENVAAIAAEARRQAGYGDHRYIVLSVLTAIFAVAGVKP